MGSAGHDRGVRPIPFPCTLVLANVPSDRGVIVGYRKENAGARSMATWNQPYKVQWSYRWAGFDSSEAVITHWPVLRALPCPYSWWRHSDSDSCDVARGRDRPTSCTF